MLLSLDNIYLMFIADSQVTGAVWTAEAAYGCRNCRSKWFRQVDVVEDNASSPRQDWQGRQAVRHEPQGYASHTGTQCLLWMIAAIITNLLWKIKLHWLKIISYWHGYFWQIFCPNNGTCFVCSCWVTLTWTRESGMTECWRTQHVRSLKNLRVSYCSRRKCFCCHLH